MEKTLSIRVEKAIDLLAKVAEDITDPVRCYRLAAGVWYKNNLVGLGVNSYKTDPFHDSPLRVRRLWRPQRWWRHGRRRGVESG